MARQLRQTRGRKGPRKTRKQGKRKGGKTRKRVVGKRRKRTMRGGANEHDYVKITGDIDEKNIIGETPIKGRTYIVTFNKDYSIMILTDIITKETFEIRTGMSDTRNNTINAFEAVDQYGNPIPIKRNQMASKTQETTP